MNRMLAFAALLTSAAAIFAPPALAQRRAPTEPHPAPMLGPFALGMTLAQIDSVAATERFRWAGRDWHYDGIDDLHLYEVRDTSGPRVVIYGLALSGGRIEQIELHANAHASQADGFGRWLTSVVTALAGPPAWSSVDGWRHWCLDRSNAGSATVLLNIRGPLYATIIVTRDASRAGCIRC